MRARFSPDANDQISPIRTRMVRACFTAGVTMAGRCYDGLLCDKLAPQPREAPVRRMRALTQPGLQQVYSRFTAGLQQGNAAACFAPQPRDSSRLLVCGPPGDCALLCVCV